MADAAPVREAPCGAWPSPLAAEALASASLRLGSPSLHGDALLWLEGRPAEAGRTVLVRRTGDSTSDVTPAPLDLRSRVHEYGGGAYTHIDDDLVFVDARSGALLRQRPTGPAEVLTAPGPAWRFGDLTADPTRQRILAVAEVRRKADAPPDNVVVAVDLGTGALEVLLAGADFYASPTPSPDGTRLAWLSWNHPHLPWDAAALYLADLDAAGHPQAPRHVAGDASASAQQPLFADDGTLYFLLEAAGYLNLHRLSPSGPQLVAPLPQSELGLPLWQLGMRTVALTGDGHAIAAAITRGQSSLCEIDLASGRVRPLPLPLAQVSHLDARGDRVLLAAGFTDRPAAIALYQRSTGRLEIVRAALTLDLAPAYLSRAEPITFATSEGDEAHGFFYPPRNPTAQAPAGELPPLIVNVHGGPTALATPSFAPLVQYFTTRGLAVLDVNYRGSTGYGRAYRERLQGQWGVYDVADCIAGVRALIAAGRVDPRRIAIRGSSAGGFTALLALVQGDGVFAAGASLYGVTDLAALASDTHKFESRYLDGLIGPWPARRDLYAARSPINHAAALTAPVIFFQGLEDRVVPPDQAERLVAALMQKGLGAELHTFAGEQHGFRRAETVATVYRRELQFYGRVFGFAADAGPAPAGASMAVVAG